MMNIARLSVKKLLGYAIRAEMDANAIYMRMAKRVKNPLLKEKFQILAVEEKKHKDILGRLFGSLYGKEKPAVPRTVDKRLLPAVVMKPSSSLVDILGQAMNSERSAQDFYAALAKRVQDPNGKMFVYLSHVENSHYLMLRSEYTLALQFEDYAEKDIDRVIT